MKEKNHMSMYVWMLMSVLLWAKELCRFILFQSIGAYYVSEVKIRGGKEIISENLFSLSSEILGWNEKNNGGSNYNYFNFCNIFT